MAVAGGARMYRKFPVFLLKPGSETVREGSWVCIRRAASTLQKKLRPPITVVPPFPTKYQGFVGKVQVGF